ncbi:hypothetical protein A2U01_0032012, partial [Trifolium medium]|nr:hypothetical protein [Trifolium medium]
MSHSDLYLQLKLILTWASECFLHVPPFSMTGHVHCSDPDLKFRIFLPPL